MENIERIKTNVELLIMSKAKEKEKKASSYLLNMALMMGSSFFTTSSMGIEESFSRQATMTNLK